MSVSRYIDPHFYIKDGVKTPVFHLAGQHDQSSHGNWAGISTEKGLKTGVGDFSDTFSGFFDPHGLADKNMQIKMAGATALSEIDKIHGLEKDWPDVIALVDNGEFLGEDEGSLGAYMVPEPSDDPETSIDRGRVVFRATDSGGNMSTTLVHELGHHLTLGKGVDHFDAEREKAGPLKDLMQALEKTNTGRDIENIENNMVTAWNKAKAEGNDDKADGIMDQLGFVQYLHMPAEMFARAYAQYIAVKSNHPQMLASINESLQDKGSGGIMQWLPNEFSSVIPLMDRYLDSRGLLRK